MLTKMQIHTTIKMLFSAAKPVESFEDIALIVGCEIGYVRNIYRQIRHIKDGSGAPAVADESLINTAKLVYEGLVSELRVKNTREKRKTYSRQFKQAAVDRIVRTNESPTLVANELGVNVSTMNNWIRQLHGVKKPNF